MVSKRHVRSETGPSSPAPAKEEIGSRVFPLPAPAPAPEMPSVGARRRPTSVFVPKSKPSAVAPSPTFAKLRPVKQSLADVADNDWLSLLSEWSRDRNGGGSGKKVAPDGPAAVDVEETAPRMEERLEKPADIVYTRKRARARENDSCDSTNNRFGIVYKRRPKAAAPVIHDFFSGSYPRNVQSPPPNSESLAHENDVISDFRRALERKTGNRLAIIVQIRYGGSCDLFLRFFLSVLRWMTKKSKENVRLKRFISFLMEGPVARVFSLHGVHLLPFHCFKDSAMQQALIYTSSCGICTIHGANKSIPVLSLNFLSLPTYFKTLHLTILLSSLYKPSSLNLSPSALIKENNSNISTGKIAIISEPHQLVLLEGARPKKNHHHQRRKSSSKPSPRQTWCTVHPVRPKPLDITPPPDYSSIDESSDVSTPLARNRNKKSSLKSPVDRVHERLALAEVKQNIDSVHCKANILVTLSDRCYREEDVVVSMELSEESESNDWVICVTLQDKTRFFHKPVELRPCVVNRFTHAYMWSVNEVMKLEFMEKWEWVLFKELHIECRSRNSRVKMVKSESQVKKAIPIPGVREVPFACDLGTCSALPFVRPPDMYIRVSKDEVERAMEREGAVFEADSEDERWVDKFNCDMHVRVRVSMEEFERVMSEFEKDAYNNPERVGDLEGLVQRCRGLEQVDGLVDLYQYWVRKRSRNGAPLIRVFQGTRMRRAQFVQKPFLRKKRSFKRQRSQTGRGKSESFLQDWAEEEAIKRVREAESAANHAVDSAVHLRNKAQTLMEYADVATYRSVMALRIAQTLTLTYPSRVSGPTLDLD